MRIKIRCCVRRSSSHVPIWVFPRCTSTGRAVTEFFIRSGTFVVASQQACELLRERVGNALALSSMSTAMPRFESSRPSQPVRSQRRCFRVCENRRHFRGLGLVTRTQGSRTPHARRDHDAASRPPGSSRPFGDARLRSRRSAVMWNRSGQRQIPIISILGGKPFSRLHPIPPRLATWACAN